LLLEFEDYYIVVVTLLETGKEISIIVEHNVSTATVL
jgi:hypothetical protein